ncbi:uncharacterized protein LOC129927425 [Biomphalaria glabrata]|uniref:Uncharacterized protein LOC129927425 n=1 Tax=Biomphalaria glabrata TaxID=6526 RepID=A0A9W3AZ22_BIOGL|nr:uncharacterized protein LOC129927425 [Biomphalaria glabrata]XP_055892474.1 uncharacterized protein LOC129927425 [Biomphalaria glabrata]XP_055892475.1 uncharacterized protein LOC129927425 [Biomphalaria glabrata]KAI8761980.1 hypothetical protein BgiMline_004916 [Biomphalaria glabrata]
MCRWGCEAFNSTFMCKWCGTRYCRECLKGEFTGAMKESTHCVKCNQKRCQGQKVETVLKEYMNKEEEKGGKRSSSSASSKRNKTSAKKGKSGSGKKSGKSKSGKKGGKKKKKKK